MKAVLSDSPLTIDKSLHVKASAMTYWGKGCYTANAIPPDTYIGPFKGRVYSLEEFKIRKDYAELSNELRCIWLGNYVVYGEPYETGKNPLNFCAEPNDSELINAELRFINEGDVYYTDIISEQ